MRYRVLLVDDDREMLEITSAALRKRGFWVNTASEGVGALSALRRENPDCVVLDIMMPGQDGFQLCREMLRYRADLPVIFLTGRSSEDDKVRGLTLGADDYMVKPFSLRELEARIRSVIRRRQPLGQGRLSFPPLEIDPVTRQVYIGQELLHLTQQEYSLLHYFALSPGKEMVYRELGEMLWGHYTDSDRQGVMVSVSRLRKKLEGNPVTARMIETLWAVGYRFVGKRSGEDRENQTGKR